MKKKTLMTVAGISTLCIAGTLFAASMIMKFNGGGIIQTSKQLITELSTKAVSFKKDNDRLQTKVDELEQKISDLENNSGSATPGSPTWDELNAMRKERDLLIEEVRKANLAADDLRMHMQTVVGNLEVDGIHIDTVIDNTTVSTEMVPVN